MNSKNVFYILIIVTVSMTFIVGRNFRTGQVPNGTKFSCNTCHTNGGGTPRNPFGLEIQNNFLTAVGSSGNVEWGPELAALDSDGDGFTNGQELQDPNGEWTSGTPQPGDIALVTNPGDADDFPTSINETDIFPQRFELANNYPNPFNPNTKISFQVAENSQITLEIYNLLGERVRTLVNEIYSPGTYYTIWNAKDDFGNEVNSGVYIYRMVSDKFTDSKRMVLMK